MQIKAEEISKILREQIGKLIAELLIFLIVQAPCFVVGQRELLPALLVVGVPTVPLLPEALLG